MNHTKVWDRAASRSHADTNSLLFEFPQFRNLEGSVGYHGRTQGRLHLAHALIADIGRRFGSHGASAARSHRRRWKQEYFMTRFPASRGTSGSKVRLIFCGYMVGAALEAMDFLLFPLVASTLVSLWRLRPSTTGGITSATLLCSSVGSLLAGYASERFGGRRTMQLALLLLSAGSLLAACAQNAIQLLAFRALLGFGFGIDAVVAAAALRDALGSKDRERAAEFYQGFHAAGWILALAVQALAYSLFRPHIAWRLMFAVGVTPALIIFFIRQNIAELAVAVSPRRSATVSSGRKVFLQDSSATVAAFLLTAAAQGSFYALMTWLPQFLRTERHISVLCSIPYLLALTGGCLCGYVFGGWFSIQFGRWRTLAVSALMASVTVVIYIKMPLGDQLREALGLPLGCFAAACYPALIGTLNQLLAARTRRVDFTYHVGRAFGACFPLAGGVLSARIEVGNAIIILVAAGSLILIIPTLWKTRGMPRFVMLARRRD
ncbi:MFS transporter [uncultured Methylovirgula sp.]|uniref:MFS transporter n=1 Tax=uncultured Methylovirgula sp. TaxID=1285960 RepID=UPI0026039B8A|nr:MFS transporter [uncultured Methylovirgula sp.]